MIEIDMAVTPPGLKGLNALAMRLNSLVTAKRITAWHLASVEGSISDQPRDLF
jgi:hypothetical protein